MAAELTYEKLNNYRWEAIQQPAWRMDAQINEDYYDGNQYDAEALQSMKERGIPPVVVNLVGPTVDLILGMEVRSRTDWVARPEGNGEWDDVAMALSKELKEAERMANADEECGEAYADEVTAGIGWIEVSREPNPFRYRYRVKKRDWREFWWDPRSEEPDLSDARYLIRRRFYDRDHLEKVFPKKAREIREIGPGYSAEDFNFSGYFEADVLSRGERHYRDYTSTELDWIDLDRNRLQLEEVWYREWEHVMVIEAGDGRVIEYDENNPIHVQAVQRGLTVLRRGVVPRMRRAFWIGPLKVADGPTPHPHHDFPYVPFWGYREARTRVPYGIVRRMRPLQDEVNARRSKMLWGLSASRVMADDDAVKDHERTRLEVARRDAYIVRNPHRRNANGIEIDDNFSLNQQQFEVYQDSKQTLQDAGGVYQTMLGKKESGADSGVAIQSLVEQGSTTLARINSNYRNAKTRVGQMLMSFIVEDLKGKQKQVKVDSPQGRKVVHLNQPKEVDGATDDQLLDNDVQRAHISVAVDDAPSTATFRAQQYQRMAEMVQSLPAELQAPLLDMVVEASDLPNREKFAERIRQIAGIAADPEKMTPEQRQQMEEQAAKAEREERMALEMQNARIAKEKAGAQHEAARAQQEAAEARKTAAETAQVGIESARAAAETRKTATETEEIEQDMAAQREAEAANDPPADAGLIYKWR